MCLHNTALRIKCRHTVDFMGYIDPCSLYRPIRGLQKIVLWKWHLYHASMLLPVQDTLNIVYQSQAAIRITDADAHKLCSVSNSTNQVLNRSCVP